MADIADMLSDSDSDDSDDSGLPFDVEIEKATSISNTASRTSCFGISAMMGFSVSSGQLFLISAYLLKQGGCRAGVHVGRPCGRCWFG